MFIWLVETWCSVLGHPKRGWVKRRIGVDVQVSFWERSCPCGRSFFLYDRLEVQPLDGLEHGFWQDPDPDALGSRGRTAPQAYRWAEPVGPRRTRYDGDEA